MAFMSFQKEGYDLLTTSGSLIFMLQASLQRGAKAIAIR